jgi:hypothetical protein
MRKIAFFLVFFMFLVSSFNVFAKQPKKELSGAELWAQNCGRCHNVRGINEFNDAQWEIIVRHMRVVGNIPGDQARAILKFLQEANNPPPEEIK